ncbi:lactoylglutathione lyase [Planctomycetales bacterium]|nr:lactoylglutathione lyase [Planctomycetales bacterium]
MLIEHMAIYVRDLERLRDFYEKYFGARVEPKYHNPKTGLQAYFLNFDGGSRLELMTRPELTASAKHQYQEGFIHIAFRVDSRDAVNALTEKMRGDGIKVVGEPRLTGTGGYESCVFDPENNLVEITD